MAVVVTLAGSGGAAITLDVVRSARARTMRLMIDPRCGAVRLTLPKRAALNPAIEWAQTKRSWIEAQLIRLPVPQPIEPGAVISVGGVPLTIDWQADRLRAPQQIGDRLLVGGPRDRLGPRVLAWLKRQARVTLAADTATYAARAGVTIDAVSIGDPVSRWGSCSARGAIRYSWRLILAPAFVRKATVAHEVAHRLHMNHSPAFHAAVAHILGDDPAPARAWLRTHGASLHWFGRS